MLKISPKCSQQNTMLVAQTLKRRHILSDTGYRMDIYMQELVSANYFPYLNSYLIFFMTEAYYDFLKCDQFDSQIYR